MTFDFYAELASQKACPTDRVLPGGLASGFVDGCTHWFWWNELQRAEMESQTRTATNRQQKRDLEKREKELARRKEEARQCYIRHAQAAQLNLPNELCDDLTPNVSAPLLADWLGLEVSFELETPWYSKDDRPFHVMDNPVRKDRVFGVPYMSATSWKGMLRWACRVQAELLDHLEKTKGKFEGWEDPPWILHLFGNEKGEEKDFRQGALIFYPTWFDKIGFEVINPHSRARRAGTQPIYYEVVPPEVRGILYLLYAPWPGMKDPPGLDRKEAIKTLLEAIEQLLTKYGISAKRTVGWGTAKITGCKAYRKGRSPVSISNYSDLWNQIGPWFDSGGRP